MLFVGNYDNGIQLRTFKVLNIDDAFVGETNGELARKCVEVAPRATHMLDRMDGALLYEPLSEHFRDYFAELYGYQPLVFCPRRRLSGPEDSLSLLRFALDDPDLLSTLSQTGKEHGWHISPFIHHPLVFELGRRIGLPVVGMSEELVRADRVVHLNDKELFQLACKPLSIPLPPSWMVYGWENLMRATERRIQSDGHAFLRRSRAAGGKGNCKITPELISASKLGSVRNYLEHVLHPHNEWTHETVLVEPVLDLVSSPSVLAYVDGTDWTIVAMIDQVIDGESYIGGDFPSKESTRTKLLLETWMKDYLIRYFIPQGGQGWVDIDFGRLADGSFVAFESNARVTGNNHGIAIRNRLLNGSANAVHAWTNDALKVAPGTSLDDVLRTIGSSYLWNPQQQEGIVISIPPAGDAHHFSMGYVALAQTNERKFELRDIMDAFARQTWQSVR